MNNYRQFNWVTTWLLSIVTCNIYFYYVIGYMSASSNAEAQKYGVKQTMNVVLAIVLSFVTCGITLIVWLYQFMEQQAELARIKGVQIAPTDNPILLVLIQFVPVYNFYVLCDNYNKIVPDQQAPAM